MYRLLIVDDEHHVVNWLADLFEKQEGMEFNIYKAYSGIEALNVFESVKINIAILDIKMPELTGLDVADRIVTHWPHCRIIFLTGYNNFDYIYHANKQKNVVYLLKAEDDKAIIKAVNEAVQALDEELRMTELISVSASREKLLDHLLQRQLLRDIVMGKGIREISNRLEWYKFRLDITKPVFLLYAKLKTKEDPQYFVDYSNHILKLLELSKQILTDKFEYTLLDLNMTSILWFLQTSDGYSDGISLPPQLYLKESLDDFISCCKRNLYCDVVFVLYPSAVDWDSASKIYELLNQYVLKFSRSQYQHSYGTVLGQHEERLAQEHNNETFLMRNIDRQINMLSSYLSHGEKEKFFEVLKQIAYPFLEVKSMHNLRIISIYQKISLIFSAYISLHHLEETVSMHIAIYPLYYLGDLIDWKEAFSYLEKLAHIIFELNSSEELDNSKNIIKTIQVYIDNHLADPLTLTHLSDMVNYNSSYISRLYKQVTGESITDYITLARVRKAKELLKNTDHTIQDIAKMVGFDTSQYFFLVFKKAVGISPGNYRSQ